MCNVNACSLVEEASGDYGIGDRSDQNKSRKNSLFWVSIKNEFSPSNTNLSFSEPSPDEHWMTWRYFAPGDSTKGTHG